MRPLSSPIIRADASWRFVPEDAAAAIIEVGGCGFLMQQRDDIHNILFPGCWGFFGGALDPGESMLEALQRELSEEIGLNIDQDRFAYFTRVSYDFVCVGHGQIDRDYYRVTLSTDEIAGLILGEGRSMKVLGTDEIFALSKVVPFDLWALWMFVHGDRLGLLTPDPI